MKVELLILNHNVNTVEIIQLPSSNKHIKITSFSVQFVMIAILIVDFLSLYYNFHIRYTHLELYVDFLKIVRSEVTLQLIANSSENL